MIPEENWAAFRASVDALNAYAAPLVLRKYQADILKSGGFSVVSPVSGRRLDVVNSVSLQDRIAYLIPDDPKVWLVAGFVPLGYPLCEAIMQTDGSARFVMDDAKALKDPLEAGDVERLLSKVPQETKSYDDPQVALVVGHQHFAHHVWNELAALDAWLSSASDEEIGNLRIVLTNEPLGPLRDIFPRLSDRELITEQAEIRQTLSRARISVRVGSRLVTKSVCNKIRLFSQYHSKQFALHPARGALDTAWPRIWVSVRVGSRTADNMEDFLLGIFRKVFPRYPDAVFLLNGYTFPFGFFDDSRISEGRKRKSREFALSTQSFIDKLRGRIQEELGDRIAARVLSISGLEFPDAIQFGSYCDYYICHAGALQHMIAWFNNIPGFVHSPRAEGKDSTYNLDSVEGGRIPDLVPRRFVSFSDSETRRPGLRNSNYEFSDLEKSAKFVLRSIRSQIGDSPIRGMSARSNRSWPKTKRM